MPRLGFFSFLLLLFACNRQTSQLSYPLEEFEFKSIFGTRKDGDTTTAYCLLGQGFFRAERSDNADSLMLDWMKKHPNARVVPVSSFAINEKNQEMTYCWIVDKEENLNLFLVKNGCFPGGTMHRLKTREEMSRAERKTWDEDWNLKIYIDNQTYETFVTKLIESETLAKSQKLGIWNFPDKEGKH